MQIPVSGDLGGAGVAVGQRAARRPSTGTRLTSWGNTPSMRTRGGGVPVISMGPARLWSHAGGEYGHGNIWYLSALQLRPDLPRRRHRKHDEADLSEVSQRGGGVGADVPHGQLLAAGPLSADAVQWSPAPREPSVCPTGARRSGGRAGVGRHRIFRPASRRGAAANAGRGERANLELARTLRPNDGTAADGFGPSQPERWRRVLLTCGGPAGSVRPCRRFCSPSF